MNVRFERNNGHDADVTRCLLMTHSGHCCACLIGMVTGYDADAQLVSGNN